MKEKERLKKLYQLCYGENPPANNIKLEEPIENFSRIKISPPKNIDPIKQKNINAIFFKTTESHLIASAEDDENLKNHRNFLHRSCFSELLQTYYDARLSLNSFIATKVSQDSLDKNLKTFLDKIRQITIDETNKFAISTQRLPFVLDFLDKKTKNNQISLEILQELKKFPTFIKIRDFCDILYKILYSILFKEGVKVDGWD